MQAFDYALAEPGAAAQAVTAASAKTGAAYLGGGTTLLDLMKLNVLRPSNLLDITSLSGHDGIEFSAGGLRLGALASMAQVAAHPRIKAEYPVLAQSLSLAASASLRNMARLGGNVLQRTRCNYFRDTQYTQCNKRNPGSGCAAMDGNHRAHAILGASTHCIATYPGDFAQALIALDADVEITGTAGPRVIKFADLHVLPDQTPHIETALQAGDLITGFSIAGPGWPRSVYVKIRDRESYEFALASAAVAIRLEGDVVAEARVALGGVASIPWRSKVAEASLQGRSLNEISAAQAAEAAFMQAAPLTANAYKLPLGKAVLVRALLAARELHV